MNFSYFEEKPTIEAAITQAVGAGMLAADGFNAEQMVHIADATIAEVRRIIAMDLTLLLDTAGVAQQWNDGIEAALLMVEPI